MKTQEVLKALDKALLQVDDPQKIIHHSDRGIQYRPEEYRKRLYPFVNSILIYNSG